MFDPTPLIVLMCLVVLIILILVRPLCFFIGLMIFLIGLMLTITRQMEMAGWFLILGILLILLTICSETR